MTPIDRKVAFRNKATREQKTLSAAAYEVCGVTWFHLSEGIKGTGRPLSAEVKQKFAEYIGYSVRYVFGADSAAA